MRRRAVLGGAGLAVAAAATGGWWWRRQPGPADPVSGVAASATTPVVKGDISTRTQLSGALGFRDQLTVFAQGPGGTVTALPQPGQVLDRGDIAFELDGRPVRLMFGARPAWRAFEAGMTDGADVRALEENLVALGHGAGVSIDNRFTAGTAAAIRRWQHATGQAVTGRVELGTVNFQPGPVRVTSVTSKLGATSHGEDPVLSGSSTHAAVTMAVPAGQKYLVHVGDAVTVTLPDSKTVQGRVTALSAVAEQSDQGNGRAPLPTVAGVVTLDDPHAGGDLDGAPVQISVTGQTAKDALGVPVTALVALAGGGYAVWVRDGAGRRLVGVTTGLFTDTVVEVKGDLHEGDQVEVPAP